MVDGDADTSADGRRLHHPAMGAWVSSVKVPVSVSVSVSVSYLKSGSPDIAEVLVVLATRTLRCERTVPSGGTAPRKPEDCGVEELDSVEA